MRGEASGHCYLQTTLDVLFNAESMKQLLWCQMSWIQTDWRVKCIFHQRQKLKLHANKSQSNNLHWLQCCLSEESSNWAQWGWRGGGPKVKLNQQVWHQLWRFSWTGHKLRTSSATMNIVMNGGNQQWNQHLLHRWWNIEFFFLFSSFKNFVHWLVPFESIALILLVLDKVGVWVHVFGLAISSVPKSVVCVSVCVCVGRLLGN